MAQTRVIIVGPSGTNKTTVEVPDNVQTSRLMGALLKRMGLPETRQNGGHTVLYRLFCTKEGEEREINPDQTFEEAGIENDDVLRLYAVMQAGPVPAWIEEDYKQGPVRVIIVDPSGSKKTTAEVPNNIAIQRLLTALVKKMGLPEIGQNGKSIDYRLSFWKAGEELSFLPDFTLGEHGIEDDDVLHLYADSPSEDHPYEFTLTEDSLSEIVNTAINERLVELDLSKQEETPSFFLVKKLLKELARVETISVLNLSSNQLTELPEEIGQLRQLTVLDLSDNRLVQIPESVGALSCLIRLDLHGNKIHDIPKKIGLLHNLKELDLSDNPIKELPKDISRLKHLSRLKLDYTNLVTLPKKIGRLEKLGYLSLLQSDIKELPVELVQLTNLEIFEMSSPCLTFPPLEVTQQGKEAVFTYLRNYYTPVQRRSQDTLYEAKLLIVGQGGVGKTCLMKRLTRDIFLPDQATTEGIEIYHWELDAPSGNNQKMVLNVWDFGGQEIYHATHQFFLTQRSLYMLVWDSRQEEEFGRIDYWLNTIENLAYDSPILIVMNKADERIKDLNLKDLKKQFPQISGCWKVSAKTGVNIKELCNVIQEAAWNLPLMGTSWPSSWLAVRIELEDMPDFQMPYQDYLLLCQKHGIDSDEALVLSRYLHDLGIILHFHKDVVLKDTIILKPEWGTEAVYKVLDAEAVQARQGLLLLSDLPDIWKNAALYPPDKYATLLRLMSNFELAFPLEQDDRYIVAELLSVQEPQFEWQPKTPLTFEYHYEFLPAGVMTRFIVRMHEFLAEKDGEKMCWREGACLIYEDCRALVTIHPGIRKVIIQIDGHLKREFLASIRFQFAAIHKTLRKIRYTEKVPCICSTGCEHRFDYNFLKGCEKRGKFQQTCGNSFDDVDIRILLDGFERAEQRGQYISARAPDKLLDITGEQTSISLDESDFEEPTLPHELYQEIVTFLTSLPNIHDHNALQALLYRASLDPQLHNHLQVTEPSGQFFDRLIPTLLRYGDLEDGRNPVKAILEAAKMAIGQKKQTYCETLIQKVHECLYSTKKYDKKHHADMQRDVNMSIPKICGIETEYGLIVAEPEKLHQTDAAKALLHWCPLTFKVPWDIAAESPGQDARNTETYRIHENIELSEADHAGYMLENGARLYVDHGHPEYSTPECSDAISLVAADKAGERILDQCRRRTNRFLPPGQSVRLFKNNCDSYGHSYGCHENYLLTAETYERIFRNRLDEIYEYLIPFLVSRQVICGAGKVGTRNGHSAVNFQISQRADFFETEIGLQTMYKRPIINTRDEPHADRSRFRRLHVITGDSNMAEMSTYLKIGTMQILLSMLEDGVQIPSLSLEHPVAAMVAISHDPTCKRAVPLIDGRKLRAVEMQLEFVEAAQSYIAKTSETKHYEAVLQSWVDVLEKLREEPQQLGQTLDWVIKWTLLEKQRIQKKLTWSSESLKKLDICYHEIDFEKGLFYLMQSSGKIERVVSDQTIEQAIHEPVSSTRATLRAEYLKQCDMQKTRASWEHIRGSNNQGKECESLYDIPFIV